MKVLFDTCALIYLFNSADPNHPCVRECFERCQQRHDYLYISSLSLAEYGVKGDVSSILRSKIFRVLPYGTLNAIQAAQYRRLLIETQDEEELRTEGIPRKCISIDTQIFAHAVSEGMDFVLTADRNTFARTAARISSRCGVETKVVLLDEDTLCNLCLEPPVEGVRATTPRVNANDIQEGSPQQMAFSFVDDTDEVDDMEDEGDLEESVEHEANISASSAT